MKHCLLRGARVPLEAHPTEKGVRVMKFVFLIATACLFGFASLGQAKVKVDQSQYTCSELRDLLHEYRSLWVRNKVFPFIYQNIALANPVCNGAARSHPRRICRWYEGRVTASDGQCRLGTECSCQAPEREDD